MKLKMKVFKLGDTVQYIYGGPKMTIECVYIDEDDGSLKAGCVWWDYKSNEFQREQFVESSLKKVSTEEVTLHTVK